MFNVPANVYFFYKSVVQHLNRFSLILIQQLAVICNLSYFCNFYRTNNLRSLVWEKKAVSENYFCNTMHTLWENNERA